MLRFLKRLIGVPATALGIAASLCFASSHVWAQAAPGNGASRPATAASTLPGLVAAPVIDGRVQNVAITGAKGDTIEITYANTGTTTTIIAGEVQMHVSRDSVAATIPFVDSQIIKPGETQRFRVSMPRLAKGRYMLLAIVDFGGETMTAAQAKLEIR